MNGSELVLAADVVLVPAPDGTARLLDLGGNFHSLSDMAAHMLQLVLAKGTSAAVQEISQQYEVAPVQVENDLHSLLGDLRKNRLLRRRPVRRLPEPQSGRLAYLVLAPILHCIHGLAQSLAVKVWLLLAIGRLSFLLFGWTGTMSAWQRFHSSDRKRLTNKDTALLWIDDTVRRTAANHLFEVECKERALCSWSLLRALGLPASLIMGLQFYPLSGHCWCQTAAGIVADDTERCAEYVPVVRYA